MSTTPPEHEHGHERAGLSRLSQPPEAWGPLLHLRRLATRPLERFLAIEAASGILLLMAAACALLWANSPWAGSYGALWHTPLGIRIGGFSIERSLEWLVNDALMVIFFFVVGLEIRREIDHGELSEWRRAALPIAAAVGGMVAPALLYLTCARAHRTHAGWGVPMATDIAFAVGILTLLGNRVPAALRVLLLALAVIDDLGAIIVIAVFYASGISLLGFGVAALGFMGILLLQWLGVRSKSVYVVPSLIAWAGIAGAGVHPTIAGVIIGLMTPVRAWLGSDGFTARLRETSIRPGDTGDTGDTTFMTTLRAIDVARREALSPSESLIHTLHPWVAYGIMPLFALANAGVSLQGLVLDTDSWHVILGAGVGLVLGKPLGVLAAIALALKLGIATKPMGLGPRQLVVLGIVAGVGFTMALFIAQLAFVDAALLAAAKLGVLIGSGIAAVSTLALGPLLLSKPAVDAQGAAATADEAERSTVR